MVDDNLLFSFRFTLKALPTQSPNYFVPHAVFDHKDMVRHTIECIVHSHRPFDLDIPLRRKLILDLSCIQDSVPTVSLFPFPLFHNLMSDWILFLPSTLLEPCR